MQSKLSQKKRGVKRMLTIEPVSADLTIPDEPQQQPAAPAAPALGMGPTLAELKAISLQQLEAALPGAGVVKRTYSYAELHAVRDDEQRFLVPDLIPDATVCVVIGEDGIGKTQLCCQLAGHIVLGYDTFLGLPLNAKHKRALFVATEDSRQKFIKACSKQIETMEPRRAPADIGIDFTEASDFDDFLGFKTELEAQLAAHQYDLIVMDALSDLFTLIDGEINSNSHARKILSYFQHLCNTHGCTIMIIHHAAKTKIVEKRRSGKMFVEKTDSQGAGAITQKPRTVLALTNDPKSVIEDGARYTNYLHVVKANLMGKKYMQNAIKCDFKSATLLHTAVGLVDIELMQQEAQEAVDQQEVDGVRSRNSASVRKARPQDLTEGQHHAALRMIFGQMEILKRELFVSKAAENYGVGIGKIEAKDGYLPYLLEQGWLVKNMFGYNYVRPAVTPGWQPIKTDEEEDKPKGDLPF